METPGRARRSQQPIANREIKNKSSSSDISPELCREKSVGPFPSRRKGAHRSSLQHGHTNGISKPSSASKDHRVDDSGHFEFGGSLGVSVMMIAFPL